MYLLYMLFKIVLLKCFFFLGKRDHNISHFKSSDYFPIRISLEILYMKEKHAYTNNCWLCLDPVLNIFGAKNG